MRPGDPQPPDDEDAKARIFSETSLAPVFELNRLFLDALVDASFRPASEVRPRLASTLHRPLAQLTSALLQLQTICARADPPATTCTDRESTMVARIQGGRYCGRSSAF